MSNPLGNNIRDIVLKVQTGKMDKSEAFTELKDILQQGSQQRGRGLDYSPDRKAFEDVSVDGSSVSSTARFTREDRRQIINKLIEKKKQLGRNINDNNDDDDGDNNMSSNFSPMTADAGNDVINNVGTPYIEDTEHDQRWASGQYDTLSKGSSHNRGSYSTRKPRSSSTGNFLRRSVEDNTLSQPDVRSQRIMQAELAIRQEMFRECTFRPQIKPLPASYSAAVDNEAPFYDRVEKWRKEKEQEATRRKQLTAEHEVEGCTFHPKINKNSVKAVRETRISNSNESANERLYKNAEAVATQRTRFVEEELRMERSRDELECTFQPNLATKASKDKFSDLQPKYMVIPEPKRNPTHPPVTPKELKECTFKPKVKMFDIL